MPPLGVRTAIRREYGVKKSGCLRKPERRVPVPWDSPFWFINCDAFAEKQKPEKTIFIQGAQRRPKAYALSVLPGYSNSNSKRSLRWLVEGSSTFPLSISLPEGESTLFTLSLWERVAEGRVRASVAFFLAALISSLI
jgi:hypothetical protein